MTEMTPISLAEQAQVEGGMSTDIRSTVGDWIKKILGTPPTAPVPAKPVVAR